jgi:rhodanese-related sulfurtransferase
VFKSAHELFQDAKSVIKESLLTGIQTLTSSADPLIIDVREPDGFREGHVPGAINIPPGLLEFQISNDASLQNLHRPTIVFAKPVAARR